MISSASSTKSNPKLDETKRTARSLIAQRILDRLVQSKTAACGEDSRSILQVRAELNSKLAAEGENTDG